MARPLKPAARATFLRTAGMAGHRSILQRPLSAPEAEQATHKSACTSLLLARLVRISFSARVLLLPSAHSLPKLTTKLLAGAVGHIRGEFRGHQPPTRQVPS